LEIYIKAKCSHKENRVGLLSCPDQSDKCNCFVPWTISVIAAAVIQLCSCARSLLAPGVISRALQRPPLSDIPPARLCRGAGAALGGSLNASVQVFLCASGDAEHSLSQMPGAGSSLGKVPLDGP